MLKSVTCNSEFNLSNGYLIAIFSLLFFLQSCSNSSSYKYEMPLPTNGETHVKLDMEDEEKSNLKKAWLEKLFRTPEGIDAKYIEDQNSYERFLERNHAISGRTPEEIIADGLITGEWKERGSKNQSGSVFVTEYDQESKYLYLVSAGGQLWKGTLDGLGWEIVNQKARFHDHFLDMVKLEDGSKRLLAAISNMPHYSDDGGLTWTASEGFIPLANARMKNIFTTDDSLQYTYFLGQVNSNQNLGLYQTKDKGVTYQKIFSFLTSDRRNLSLSITKNTPSEASEIYVLEQLSASTSRLHKMDANQEKLELIEPFSPVSYNQGEGNLVTVKSDSTTIFYALSRGDSAKLHVSTDQGETWIEKSTLPTSPWGVGLFVSAENPDYLMYGDIECYRSFDGGGSWEMINGWGEYYGDVINKLHADMMYFSDYKDVDTDQYFMLISNHGGISIMETYDQEPKNIALTGLNVSQYYSVRTHPSDEKYIYAGSQDQGFQRGQDKEGEILDLGQAISGDYGHIVFTTDDKLWTVYPGGWVSFWPNPTNQGIAMSYDLESTHESVWIPPLANIPNSPIDEIYMAGGNINGGPGSYLIKLNALDQIYTSQIDFDFRSASNGTVSAISIADEYEEKMYVATDNGRFFYSKDFGETWTKSANVNGGHYLYGSVIIPSKLNEEKIYTAGNGYNGVPVMRSIDGGESFEPFGNGLPNTTVLGMVMNSDESLLFAATTSGPYVCVVGNKEWHSMIGEAAPDVTYWSVELVNNDNTVRFGTYGRGIWDFEISEFVGLEETSISQKDSKLLVYPNPVAEYLTIEWNDRSIQDASIFDSNGRFVKSLDVQSPTQSYSLSDLTIGTYFLRYNQNGIIGSKMIIKL